VEPGTACKDEPKFIVFYSALLAVFSLFCFNCKASDPSVSMDSCGTMVTVNQQCQSCKRNFKWRSQPYILGRYPAGNLLSFAVLMAGASIKQISLSSNFEVLEKLPGTVDHKSEGFKRCSLVR